MSLTEMHKQPRSSGADASSPGIFIKARLIIHRTCSGRISGLADYLFIGPAT